MSIYLPFMMITQNYACKHFGGKNLQQLNPVTSTSISGQSNMDYKLLPELNSQTDVWTIKVRVIRMWDAVNFNNKQAISLDLILLDEQNNDIHATVWHNMAPKFRRDIKEGKIYYISNLRVGSCQDKFRPVPTAKKLFFRYNTDVREAEDSPPTFPLHKFHFVAYDLLAERVNDNTHLSDIIGKVIGIGPIEQINSNRGPAEIKNVKLALSNGLLIRLTLWSAAATELDDNAFAETDEPVIMVVTATIVKQFQGTYTLPTTTASKVYVNLKIPEAEEFLESSHNHGNEIEQLQSQRSSQLTIEEQIQHNRKSIQGLKELQWESEEQDKTFTCKATVADIAAKPNWYYNSCQLCPRKLKFKDDTLWCEECDFVPQFPIQRYRLQLQVTDSTGHCSFVVFDREGEKLIGIPARELANQEIAVDANNTATIPYAIRHIIGNTYIFQLKLNDFNLKEGWQNYTVSKVFDPNLELLAEKNNAEKAEAVPNKQPPASASNSKKRFPTELEEDHIYSIATQEETPKTPKPYAIKKRASNKTPK